MNDYIERQVAYEEGYEAGKRSATEEIFSKIESILDTYAGGEEIRRALKTLSKKYEEELT